MLSGIELPLETNKQGIRLVLNNTRPIFFVCGFIG